MYHGIATQFILPVLNILTVHKAFSISLAENELILQKMTDDVYKAELNKLTNIIIELAHNSLFPTKKDQTL